ncbi:hypothetical protein HHI36_002685 [Cryptolaemus montrouzieri]|uniref:Uncharacterized protein n=1 Tax=Cryptolaemus montrouzieri TaxID=559131 RepID=A0ABD2PBT2_9CUCU
MSAFSAPISNVHPLLLIAGSGGEGFSSWQGRFIRRAMPPFTSSVGTCALKFSHPDFRFCCSVSMLGFSVRIYVDSAGRLGFLQLRKWLLVRTIEVQKGGGVQLTNLSSKVLKELGIFSGEDEDDNELEGEFFVDSGDKTVEEEEEERQPTRVSPSVATPQNFPLNSRLYSFLHPLSIHSFLHRLSLMYLLLPDKQMILTVPLYLFPEDNFKKILCDYFRMLFTDEFIDHIVIATNIFAQDLLSTNPTSKARIKS